MTAQSYKLSEKIIRGNTSETNLEHRLQQIDALNSRKFRPSRIIIIFISRGFQLLSHKAIGRENQKDKKTLLNYFEQRKWKIFSVFSLKIEGKRVKKANINSLIAKLKSLVLCFSCKKLVELTKFIIN